MLLARRGLFGGALALLAAPAIIRTPGLLMPVKRLPALGTYKLIAVSGVYTGAPPHGMTITAWNDKEVVGPVTNFCAGSGVWSGQIYVPT